ncbi:MAG: BatD family protein [Brevinematales bacterium]|nr:BatD family protein [Brevinematales bacterium]
MKRIVLIFFLTFVFGEFFAEDVEINVSIENPNISLNERGLISIEVNKKAKNIIPPEGKDFEITYAGVSESSQVTIINGKMQSRHSYIYNFFFIPKRLGRIEVPSFNVEVDKSYKTKPVAFNVTKNVKKKNNVDPFSDIEELMTPRLKIPMLKLRLVPDKQTLYQNQPVIVDLYLYSDQKEALDYSLKEASPLKTDKSIYYEISSSISPIVQKEGSFYRKLLKKFVFYPVENGLLGVAPPVFVAISPYGQLEVKGDNIGVDVKPFKGGFKYIGELVADLKVSTNSLKQGEILTINLTLKGNGNLKLFSDLYDRMKIEHLFITRKQEKVNFETLRGNIPFFVNQITFEIIPEKEGEYIIPSLRIEYYNNAFVHKEIVLPQIKFKVLPDNEVNKDNPEYRVIKESKNYKFIILNPFLMFLFIIMCVLPFVALSYNMFKKKFEKDPEFRKRFMADKKLSYFLKDAERFLLEKDYKSFYLSLSKAIFYYITDKYNIPASLSFREVLANLKDKVDEKNIKALKEKYDYCQMAYSMNVDKENARTILEEVKRLLLLI